MAHLGNTLVNGDLKVLQNAAASSIQTDAIKVRTGASSTEYGVGTNGQVIKSNGTIAYWASDDNSDVNVSQTATTTNADYEVLFSVTADNTTRTEGARKNSNLKFNPSTGNLQATQLNGVTIGTPKFTDTTYPVVSTAANGLAPKVTNTANFLKGDGTWAVPTNTTYAVMTSGTSGLVPANGDNTKFLRGDATWQVPTNTTYPVVSSTANGLAPKVTSTAAFLKGDGTWAVPTNTTYSSKAEAEGGTAVSLVTTGEKYNWNHVHFGEIEPLITKTYDSTDYYASSNDWANATWYFMSVKPDSWYKPWRVKLKIHSFCPAYATMESYTYSTICGRETSTSYCNWNERYSSAHSYIACYPLKAAGFNSGYGHAIGISIYNADNRGSAYYRTFEIYYYECENCTVTFLDTPVKWADWDGTGTTNYGDLVSFDSVTRGLRETSDDNTIENCIGYFAGKTGAKGIWGSSLFMEDGNGTYQNICTASDGTVTSSNRTTATTKIANTNGFRVGSPIWYTTTNYNANTNITGGSQIYKTNSRFDTRYSFNSTLTANFFTPYKPLYLVGTINSSDGLFYLDETWWTQTPTTTGKVYVLVGAVYDSSTSYCRATLYEQNRWFRYNGSRLVEIIDGHTVDIDVPSNAVFTDTTYTNVSTAAAGLAPKVTSTAAFLKGNGTWATPTNTTYAVMTSGTSGLVPASGTSTKYLRGDATWQVPPNDNTTYAVMTSGKSGLVPASGTSTKYLRGDAQWITPANATTAAAGFMSAADKTTLDNVSSTYLPLSGGTETGAVTFNAANTYKKPQNLYNFTGETAPEAGAELRPFKIQYKGTGDGSSVTHTAYPIAVIGNNSSVSTNTPVRVGSINGTTIVGAGECAPTYAAAKEVFNGESLYLVSDNIIVAETGLSSASTSSKLKLSMSSVNYMQLQSTDGEANTAKATSFVCGNSVPSTSDGNSYGVLRLYGQDTYRCDITPGTYTTNRTITLPNISGTMAVTSQLPGVMSSGTTGLVPSGGTSAKYLRGDATWQVPDGKTWTGTSAAYSSQTIDPAVLYFITG